MRTPEEDAWITVMALMKNGELSRDWGEYVCQADYDVELYEALTIVFELVDYLRLHPDAEVPKWLVPFVQKMNKIALDDVLRMTEDDE